MITYEVRLKVNSEIKKAFEEWLQLHIKEMIGIDGFTGADLFTSHLVNSVKNEFDDDFVVHYYLNNVVHYYLNNEEDLEMYLKDHAPRMREDGLRRFKNQFSAQRNVYRKKVINR